mmetsp:Transcript_37276/g.93583  ORF Transcript_37276/g.93583 Transcript_37276/m.93583 type:complete len:179 (+) Transcript_37276:144-680(+)
MEAASGKKLPEVPQTAGGREEPLSPEQPGASVAELAEPVEEPKEPTSPHTPTYMQHLDFEGKGGEVMAALGFKGDVFDSDNEDEMDARIAALQRKAAEAEKTKREAEEEIKKAQAATATAKEAERERRDQIPEPPQKQRDLWDLPVGKASTLSFAVMLSETTAPFGDQRTWTRSTVVG